MKIIFCLLVILFTFPVSAQEIKEITPFKIKELNEEGEKQQAEKEALFNEVIDLLQRGVKLENLPKEDQDVYNSYDEMLGDYWKAGKADCSWYCGGGSFKVTASSTLEASSTYNYNAQNTHDFDLKTAWVEGVEGYGVGEYLEYEFIASGPRITNIIIANGYVKTERAWQDNSRVKKLKVYLNDKPIVVLKFEDKRAEQHFEIDPIGLSDRQNAKEYENVFWTLKFEILEVYPGDKYEDTVISEIYFDGIDVHCFAVGTLITMADRSEKPIEEIKVGEKVLSYDFDLASYFETEVTELADVIHNNLIKITWSDDSSVTCTQDHPFLNTEGQWMSFDPKKTKKDYMYDTVLELGTGSTMKTLNGLLSVKNIEILHSSQWTYTIVSLQKGNVFFANNVAVGTEPLRLKKKGKILEAIQK